MAFLIFLYAIPHNLGWLRSHAGTGKRRPGVRRAGRFETASRSTGADIV